ncbi:GNAT family N-acetyltransferase [Tetragenococcus koreensis]|uniref:N-acetyltransferase domain-containing protein n=1 Tax=Tetragenococcus koreensis TaxID=290335 RepID=A0AAN4ZNP4_9ENTE|nr:GNAT family N-acetyltransferase [Tetragenococcus koreensis]AYW46345.1 N-acetyltransferase [Tetragenococcus koreensis]MCF1585412.1 GNAT family N-acetyltransferase [Tetragenococcus koreensis]MCF1614958.1 GNAT family N-acetyltransferase [Tetragenococcus koreensis]MCF1618401.1 GNAT family N-acetyltransferase [Tetragenococcus koreensis]MCF1619342.1 GNAT family N-acetyltransferase [Tetragenococcus koreensis]
MGIYFKIVEKEEEDLVTAIMTEAFNYDAEIYFGNDAEFGPPGYSDGTLARKVLLKPNVKNYFICLSNKQIAGFLSIDLKNSQLDYFCIRTRFINQGIGTAAWQKVEEMYPGNNWQVETPAYSLRNHHFYEKLGFIKVGEKAYDSETKAFIFKK